MRTTIKRKCLKCEKEFRIQPHRVRRGEGKYCSHRCSTQARHQNYPPVGDKNPRWKGGSRNYYQRKANFLFRMGPIEIVCELCGSPKNIHIHHKDLNYKNNALTNLSSLCRSCHIRLHRLNKGVKK